MKRDFTFKLYTKLIHTIKKAGYSFQTFEKFMEKPAKKSVVLRHDSDIWPGHDLQMANIEFQEGVSASYYFRIPKTFKPVIISKIARLGHEIGYHYEDLSATRGDMNQALKRFERNLLLLRALYPVKTVAMHGSPLSKWDNRLMWEKNDLNSFGIIGEPYLSLNFNKVLYLTDTGNRWDGERVSIRDTVKTRFDWRIKTTFQLLELLEKNHLPNHIMFNTHPARWNDNLLIWGYRYFLQTAKNSTKKYLKKYLKKLSENDTMKK